MNFRKIIKDNFGDTQKKIKEWAVHKENKKFFTQSNNIQLNPIKEGDMVMPVNDKQLEDEIFQATVASDGVLTAGQGALKRTMNNYFNVIQEVRKTIFLKNEQLVSSVLLGEQARKLPKELRSKIEDVSRQIHAVFYKTALKIEEKNFSDLDNIIIASKRTSLADSQRTEKIVTGHKNMQLSYQSIRVAMELFKRINEDLLQEIEESRKKHNAGQEIDLLLKNAILVYELSDAVINFIRDFQLNGIAALNEVHEEIIREIDANKQKDEKMKKRINDNEGISQHIKDGTLNAIKTRDELRCILENQWNEFLGYIDNAKSNVCSVKNRIPDLEIIRDNAGNQLDFLQMIAVTKMIKDNLEAFQCIINIEDLELSPIRSENICKLLGIDYKNLSLAEKTSNSKL